MLLNEYQKRATDLAIYPGRHSLMGLIYVALKMNGEAGEFAEHLGKAMRDDDSITLNRKELMVKELGDVLWYIAAAADEFNFALADIAQINLDKLEDRKARGVLGGSGDNR